MAKIYSGTIGLKIQITIDSNLSGETVIYNILRPNSTTFVKTATINNPTQGITSYTTTAVTDFNIIGTYIIQPQITSGGNVFYSEPIELEIVDYYQK